MTAASANPSRARACPSPAGSDARARAGSPRRAARPSTCRSSCCRSSCCTRCCRGRAAPPVRAAVRRAHRRRAMAVDLLRLHEQRVRTFFREFFGEMIREHESVQPARLDLPAARLAARHRDLPAADRGRGARLHRAGRRVRRAGGQGVGPAQGASTSRYEGAARLPRSPASPGVRSWCRVRARAAGRCSPGRARGHRRGDAAHPARRQPRHHAGRGLHDEAAAELARTIHEPAACERRLPAIRCVARPGRSSSCSQHGCVAAGPCSLRLADIRHSRLAVHE